jgi:hypothetical protein
VANVTIDAMTLLDEFEVSYTWLISLSYVLILVT